MDLLSMVARVKSGDSSLGTIDAEINTYKELYAKNPPEDKEEFSNWADRRFSLARQLDQLVDTSTSEKTVDDLLAVSRVSVSAAARPSRIGLSGTRSSRYWPTRSTPCCLACYSRGT